MNMVKGDVLFFTAKHLLDYKDRLAPALSGAHKEFTKLFDTYR